MENLNRPNTYKFYGTEDWMTTRIKLFVWTDGAPDVATHLLAKPITFDMAEKELSYEVPSEPTLTLKREEAQALYEALGKALGKLEAENIQAVIAAKDAHINDLRQLLSRTVRS